MTDVEFLLYQDIKEKKKTARGYRAKKKGAHSKKCSLPCDRLTKKELEGMNGEMKVYKLNEFYSWEEFKSMPDDIQVEYLNSIMARYSVGLNSIAVVIFKQNTNGTLRNYLKKKELLSKVSTPTLRGAKKGRLALVEAINKLNPDPEVELENTEEPEKIEEHLSAADENSICTVQELVPEILEEIKMEEPAPVSIKNFSVTMDGFDKEVLDFLRKQYTGKKIEVVVEVKLI